MTPAEHRLIVEMFKHQTLVYAGLIKLLQSREIVAEGDLFAFDALVSASSRELLEREVEDQYRGFATILGVQTGPFDAA